MFFCISSKNACIRVLSEMVHYLNVSLPCTKLYMYINHKEQWFSESGDPEVFILCFLLVVLFCLLIDILFWLVNFDMSDLDFKTV